MEYLDPKKQKQYRLFLFIGYGLIAIAIVIGCMILLWEAYGYSVKNGQVVQNGMLFLSSQPNPASVDINGQLNAASTNTRLTINAGTYNFTLKAAGYRPWSHTIPIIGGQVVHYDYPLLFPTKLIPKTVAKYSAAPEIATESPSQQFLLVSSVTNFGSFLLYDLTNPTAAPIALTIPSSLLTTAQTTQTWKVIGWADDNQHVLLEHLYDGTSEFIELNTVDATQSININRTFNLNPTTVSLNNLKYDQFYFYDATSQVLSSGSLSAATATQVEPAVIAYKSYQSNIIVYATKTGAPAGQVAVEIDSGGQDYFVRDMPISSTYLLNMTNFSGNDYLVVGASSDNLIYLYENPLSEATATPVQKITPFRALRMNNPTFDSFAPTAQFILVESGNSFAVFDFYNNASHYYVNSSLLDAPQTHAVWMDGDRLTYVSGGKLIVADYDNTNRQTLTNALPAYQPFFAPDYHSYFTLSSGSAGSVDLKQTSLLIP